MQVTTPQNAYTNAMKVVEAALQSGSIKLLGPSTGSTNDSNINEDAKYLNGLINALAENIYR